MSIKRFIATKDTTITDAYTENLIVRGIDSNMGAADSLEVFTIYGQASTSSLETSRVLVEFPIDEIVSNRNTGKIPLSGNVSFYLKLYNVQHPFSLPKNYKMLIYPLSKSWDEGYGLDMEGYTDKGFVSGSGGYGATWVWAKSGSMWDSQGADFITSSESAYEFYFEKGTEDIEIDITNLTEKWISSEIENNGLIVKLSSSLEDGSTKESYYTKKFSARSSQFYMRRPCIEARWDPSIIDDRNNFYASSSLLNSTDNTMNIYFYNRVNGLYKNIVDNPVPAIKFYTDSQFTNEITASYLSVSNPLPGVYKGQVALDTTASIVYDKWVNPLTSSIKYFSSSIDVLQRETDYLSEPYEYVLNITNLKQSYSQKELARFNIFVREYDWQPNIYTKAYNNVENTSIPNLYYKIFRFNDNYTIIDYSTGSIAYSKTSYDSNGNYFELDMNILEKDYGYGIKLALWDGNQLKELKETFKFRVD